MPPEAAGLGLKTDALCMCLEEAGVCPLTLAHPGGHGCGWTGAAGSDFMFTCDMNLLCDGSPIPQVDSGEILFDDGGIDAVVE